MYQSFSIKKQTGTYSETLEAFGVANLVSNIFAHLNIEGVQIKIEDKGSFYCVSSNKSLTNELLDKLSYFLILKFIKKEANQTLPDSLMTNDYFDYPAQKVELANYQLRYKEIEGNKLLNNEQKKLERKKLSEEKLSEFGKKLDVEFDVYREIIKNPYASFSKLFDNFYQNRDNFRLLVKEILYYYTDQPIAKRSFKLADEKPTSQQLYNPNQGKGLNRGKANNPSMGNLDSHWISETMKISGALDMMVCQYVKVGSSYDLKIFVPEFNDILLHTAKDIVFIFKQHLKSTSPIKLDIINSLDFTEKFIKKTPEYNKGKVKNTIKGFHSVYQKDLGQNKAVANIAFIQTPDFVKYQNKEESLEWIEILSQQKSLISNIEELGDSMQGLQAYRSFLGSVSNTALNHFSKFNYWYSGYLMQQLTKGNKFVRTFKIEHLNKFYHNMEPKLSEIINNEGFKAVAGAIRNSTVRLQRLPKESREFEIRYGFAQDLQNKSRNMMNFLEFIGGFITKYNADTAKYVENKLKKQAKLDSPHRPLVKQEELDEFYKLCESVNNSSLIGALLSSYGFATEKYNVSEEDKLKELADKLGYQLIKNKAVGQESDENEQNQDNQEDINQ